MLKAKDDRKAAWRPPERPDWVAAINREGDYMDIRAVVPLDAESLLRTAERNTGLSDYGDDDWREPFEIICKDMDDNAHLNLMGRLMCRSDMLMFLEGRLRIEETYRLHPEIEDEVITQPMFVVGQGRTGTSALLNNLAAIPGNGAVKTWEAMFPCPPPEQMTYLTDPRSDQADKLIRQWVRVVPELDGIHEFTGEIPCECVQFMTFSFTTIWFNVMAQLPRYTEYMARANWQSAYRYHRRVLRLLQWKNPRKHWVLKATEHLGFMREILEIYPDACFIWPHRDPIVAVASSTSLTGHLNWVRSNHPYLYPGFEKYNSSEMAVAMLEEPIEWLESGAVPRDRLCNVQYQDFLKDTAKCVEGIYEYFGFPFTDEMRQALRQYVEDNPRAARPPHEYHHGTPERIGEERQMFKRYQDYFAIPSEL